MANPTDATTIPHLLGVALNETSIQYTQVVATNANTGARQISVTNINRVAIFDASKFTNGYTDGDKILFENVGASKGGGTITIDTAGGFQQVAVTCTVALTVAVDI